MNQIGVGTFKVTPRMRELVNEVLSTGRISYGPMSKAFETQFAELHGADFAVLSNSGTSSLQVALQTLKELHGWKDGDEVLIPSVTFVATANAVLHNRLTPVLVDIEPDLYGMDPALVDAKITNRTRAMMPVHLFGQPCNMAELTQLARINNLKIIEDSCECMFADHHDVSAGAWGDIGCFSTYVAHLLTTGVGGIAVTSDPEYAAVMRSLVNHGRDGIYLSIDDDNGVSADRLKEIISKRFRFERIGHSFRITELEAALGLAQLEDWHPMIEQRRANAATLTQALSSIAEFIQLPAIRPNTTHSWMMYPLVMRHEPKARMMEYLETHGIETREMLPLTNQPAYKGWCRERDYPVAQWINRNGFYVGIHQDLTGDDLAYMADVITDYFRLQSTQKTYSHSMEEVMPL